MSVIRKAAVYVLLVGVYGLTWLLTSLAGIIPRRPWQPTGRIIVTGTFHNPNWYLSHVMPLARSGVKEVILIVDGPQLPLDRVRFVCPPRWALTLLSRAGAKAIWMLLAGLRYRPDLYMGYHIAPGACMSLVVGRLMGRPACYQMTGGPIEILGGGYAAADSIEGWLGCPSKLIEALALHVVRRFDLVIVRGSRAKEFLASHGVRKPVVVITGSVNEGVQPPGNHRDVHLVFVGRLSPIKQVDQFIEIVAVVRQAVPGLRAAIVGDGPLRGRLQARAEQLELGRSLEFLGKRRDVGAVLSRSRIFVLTSQSEGMSIAMIEAMAAGAVPVVANVGELGDLVVSGVNGYLVRPNGIDEYVDRIVPLLQERVLWQKCSDAAMEAARKRCDIEVVSQQWHQHLQQVVVHAAGIPN